MESPSVNPRTLVSETIASTLRIEPLPIAAPSKTTNRAKKLQRQKRRKQIRSLHDMRTSRTVEQRAEKKLKDSVRLQKRAIRGYWRTALQRSTAAALSDKTLMDRVKTSAERDKILFDPDHGSCERQDVRKRMSHAYKQAKHALKLLQTKNILKNTDVKYIEQEDIEKIVLHKKIAK